MNSPIRFRAIAVAAAAAACASAASAAPVFSSYHESWEAFNYNTSVMQTKVSGSKRDIGSDVTSRGATAVTLAFATGACGSEDWNGNAGSDVASANVPKLVAENTKYIVSTGGAGASFTCSSDSGMTTFINRWNSANLIGIDFDIEDGQSSSVITALVQRVKTAHASHPSLRFSFTIATEAVNNGGTTAVANLGTGKGASDPYNGLDGTGNSVMSAIKSVLGWDGTAANWPSYVTINLMTMDFGPAQKAYCVVSGGKCQMGQSSVQAAYNQVSAWKMPYSGVEITPMLGGNDTKDELFQLTDVDTLSSFALSKGLGGVHYWAWDRDTPCATGAAKDNCNSMGTNTKKYGYIDRFVADGLK